MRLMKGGIKNPTDKKSAKRILKKAMPVGLGRAINFLKKHNVTYITNQKAACTTIKMILNKMEDQSVRTKLSSIHKKNKLIGINDISEDDLIKIIRGNCFTFSFVRNPVDRFISCYNDKIATGKINITNFLKKNGINEIKHQVSPEEFISVIEKQNPYEMNPHWRPQNINLFNSVIKMNFIGRLENFDRDMKLLSEFTGIRYEEPIIKNKSKADKIILSGRKDLILRIEKIYEKDYDVYGY